MGGLENGDILANVLKKEQPVSVRGWSVYSKLDANLGIEGWTYPSVR
jgi:hypothetical protein